MVLIRIVVQLGLIRYSCSSICISVLVNLLRVCLILVGGPIYNPNSFLDSSSFSAGSASQSEPALMSSGFASVRSTFVDRASRTSIL